MEMCIRDRYKGIIKNFTLMSDIFMRNVFKKRECLEYVLQVIMEKQDLYVIDQVIQKDYKNLQGRSAVMDCVARDSTSKQFDVEIQQDNEGASPKMCIRDRLLYCVQTVSTAAPYKNRMFFIFKIQACLVPVSGVRVQYKLPPCKYAQFLSEQIVHIS